LLTCNIVAERMDDDVLMVRRPCGVERAKSLPSGSIWMALTRIQLTGWVDHLARECAAGPISYRLLESRP